MPFITFLLFGMLYSYNGMQGGLRVLLMKVVSENRKATFSYFICDTFQAGLVLLGSEVKSIRNGGASLSDAYIVHRNRELYVHGMHISQYAFAGKRNHEPKRERKLLMRKNEIIRVINFLKIGGNAVIPLTLYFNDKNSVKLKICTAKGKKLRDKREEIKKREWEREKRRLLTKF